MKVQFNATNFRAEVQKTYNNGNHVITETYNDNVLVQSIEYDEFGRDIDSKWYDADKKVIEHMHKSYFETDDEKGHIEKFKNRFQDYTRKMYTRFEVGFRHIIDDFTSHLEPHKSYKNEFVYDLHNRLIKNLKFLILKILLRFLELCVLLYRQTFPCFCNLILEYSGQFGKIFRDLLQ